MGGLAVTEFAWTSVGTKRTAFAHNGGEDPSWFGTVHKGDE
jgi:hypothetical protein